MTVASDAPPVNTTPSATDSRPRVLLVDDHEVLAQLLVTALGREGMDAFVAEDLRTEGVLQLARELQPDVAILDLYLGPFERSLPMIRPLTGAGIPVIILSGSGDDAELGECLEAGASCIIRKSEPLATTVAAVQHVAEGSCPMRPAARDTFVEAARAARAEAARRAAPFSKLTAREGAVLASLMNGKSVTDIATEDVVSVNTVRGHVKALLDKLGVRSQTAAVALAYYARWTRDGCHPANPQSWARRESASSATS